MIAVVLILGLVLVSGVAIGWELLRLGRSIPEIDLQATAVCIREESYRPIGRLFASEDLALVEHRPDLKDKLLKSRRAVMRLYLTQLRQDFARIWTVCRLLTPVSDDPNFAYSLVRQTVLFHSLFALAYARCAWGFRAPVEVDISSLVDSFRELNQQAVQLLQMPDQLPSAA